MTSSETSSQNIPSWAIHPWRVPGVCPQTNPQDAQGFLFIESGWTTEKRISRYRNSPSVFQILFQSEKGLENTSSKQWCYILWGLRLHLHVSEMSSSQSLSYGGRHGLSPNPHPFISSSTFQSVSGDLYRTTLTDLNSHVRGVCNPSKGIVNVASIAMLTAS